MPQKFNLSDDHTLEATSAGVVDVRLRTPGGGLKVGRLSDVLYVPTLAYNLLSVAKVADVGKTVTFGDMHAEIVNDEGKVVAVVSKVGNLYYLDCELIHNQQVNSASHQLNEILWHQRFGHLGERNLRKLKKAGLVKGFNYDVSKDIDFCEPCVHGKIHQCSFSKNG